jgi:hypothetical protein
VKILGDRRNHHYEDEEIKRIERPSKESGKDGIELIGSALSGTNRCSHKFYLRVLFEAAYKIKMNANELLCDSRGFAGHQRRTSFHSRYDRVMEEKEQLQSL